jgi:5,10-methylene-tetrahydrofolate dehydrogenase/methenyl tetrahydrofolate cyclohydrolase
MFLLDGKKASQNIKDALKTEIDELINTKNIQPGLGIILVGERKDSHTYVRMKKNACKEVNINNFDVVLPEDVDETTLLNNINEMNQNTEIHGILIQLPLPAHINEERVLSQVKLIKDVDGFHPENIGNLALKRLENICVPCTPSGCLKILDFYDIEIAGKHCVIVGRSNIVGMPLSLLLLHRNATVTICHSITKDLPEQVKRADIIFAACGRTQMIKKDWVKEGAVVVDIGINAVDDSTKKAGYRLVGDVDFEEVKDVASAITPVPGGIGPMTIAMLLEHTVKACKRQCL